jgi:ABC-type multidrug transport system ATPase subunit
MLHGVRLEAVGKRYGVRQDWIVRDVTLDVRGGQIVRVEGRNGSGKSTLLRVAAGVSLPSRGRVSGRPHVGYVPERFPGGFAFSCRDYLTHMARVHGLQGAAVAARVDEWLDRLGAAEFAGEPLRTLSKGMCQKVAVAQALLSRPGLLVLDEAWTGLDQAARGALDAAVRERAAEGGTVLFVDHADDRLAGAVDQRWMLDGGGSVRVSGAVSTVGGPTVVVEVSGLSADAAAGLAELPGVLSCSGGIVRVDAAHSDEVLRWVLSLDGVHVVTVRP